MDLGCENIVFVSPIGKSSVGILRHEGYKKALMDNGCPYDTKMVVNYGPQDDLELLLTFVLTGNKIDAILGLDEITAVKILHIVKSRGYEVPRDIAIIGFTNGRLSEYVSPSLTMVSQHGKYIGESAAKLLIQRIENPDAELPFKTKVVKTSLIIRESTKKPL